MGEDAYVLVTPARNEAAYIEKTIEAVCAQSVLPKQWIIVSDGSTDATDGIVGGYADRHPFMRLHRTSGPARRGVAAKVAAVRAGTALLSVDYAFWGNLDADVSFEPTYFEEVLDRFAAQPRLGIAGGLICELAGGAYSPQRVSLESVAGAVQLFRRACYEAVGGYLPIELGGEDAAAEVMARMAGWEVRTFPELRVLHHRRVGLGTGRLFSAKVNQGRMDRVLGYHPLFEIFRCCYRLVDRPYVLGSVLRLAGYVWSVLRREEIALPAHVVAYLRKEQLGKLRALARGGKHREGT